MLGFCRTFGGSGVHWNKCLLRKDGRERVPASPLLCQATCRRGGPVVHEGQQERRHPRGDGACPGGAAAEGPASGVVRASGRFCFSPGVFRRQRPREGPAHAGGSLGPVFRSQASPPPVPARAPGALCKPHWTPAYPMRPRGESEHQVSLTCPSPRAGAELS